MRTRFPPCRSLACAAAMAGLFLQLGGSATSFPGTNGRIAFDSVREGNRDIYSMNADGTDQVRLTTDAAVDSVPSYSPDGTRIVFVSARDGNNEIYVMNAGGSGETRLTTTAANVKDEDPVFSGDGSEIIFESDRDGDFNVYSMSSGGGTATPLTSDPGGDSDPVASPDGTIAFATNRDGDFNVYLMNGDGSAESPLTTDTTGADFDPAFSPDGTQVVYTSNRDSGDLEIYKEPATGSAGVRLTTNSGIDGDAVFSPDGARIAFERNVAGNNEIHVMNADGGSPTNVTQNAASDVNPDWGVAVSAPPDDPPPGDPPPGDPPPDDPPPGDPPPGDPPPDDPPPDDPPPGDPPPGYCVNPTQVFFTCEGNPRPALICGSGILPSCPPRFTPPQVCVSIWVGDCAGKFPTPDPVKTCVSLWQNCAGFGGSKPAKPGTIDLSRLPARVSTPVTCRARASSSQFPFGPAPGSSCPIEIDLDMSSPIKNAKQFESRVQAFALLVEYQRGAFYSGSFGVGAPWASLWRLAQFEDAAKKAAEMTKLERAIDAAFDAAKEPGQPVAVNFPYPNSPCGQTGPFLVPFAVSAGWSAADYQTCMDVLQLLASTVTAALQALKAEKEHMGIDRPFGGRRSTAGALLSAHATAKARRARIPVLVGQKVVARGRARKLRLRMPPSTRKLLRAKRRAGVRTIRALAIVRSTPVLGIKPRIRKTRVTVILQKR